MGAEEGRSGLQRQRSLRARVQRENGAAGRYRRGGPCREPTGLPFMPGDARDGAAVLGYERVQVLRALRGSLTRYPRANRAWMIATAAPASAPVTMALKEAR